jgi:hypothetical protein
MANESLSGVWRRMIDQELSPMKACILRIGKPCAKAIGSIDLRFPGKSNPST